MASDYEQLKDYGRQYGVQTGELVSSVGRGAKAVGLDSVGQAIADVGTTTSGYWKQNITPETQALLAQPTITDDGQINVRKLLMNQVVEPTNALIGVAAKAAPALKYLDASTSALGGMRGIAKGVDTVLQQNLTAKAAAKRRFR